MKSTANHIAELILKKIAGELSDTEYALLEEWINSSEANRAKYEELVKLAFVRRELKEYNLAEVLADNMHPPVVEEVIPEASEAIILTPVHRVPLFRRRWLRYAAALVLLSCIGAYLWINNYSGRSSNRDTQGSVAVNIEPGGNKAVLTIDDRKIDLSSDKSGIEVGNTVKYTDGEQVSNLDVPGDNGGNLYTLSTPNGGQYQLVLPDGTKAWLNAASSISFPAAFERTQRVVKVTGEVYLEVSKDKKRPFIVDVNERSTVEVLGTHFNINAYDNEDNIQTTLLEGAVRVSAGPGKLILAPGEQAQVNRQGTIRLAKNINLEQVIAWKSGVFDLNGLSLQEVMRQVERWYDIEVVYENGIPDITFGGEMGRAVGLQDLLKFMEGSKVHFRIEGKRLIVLP